jgi:hypothetical protein
MQLRPALAAAFPTFAIVGLPGLAPAQELSASAGFALTSEYVSSGLTQSDGPAFPTCIEPEMNGFHA